MELNFSLMSKLLSHHDLKYASAFNNGGGGVGAGAMKAAALKNRRANRRLEQQYKKNGSDDENGGARGGDGGEVVVADANDDGNSKKKMNDGGKDEDDGEGEGEDDDEEDEDDDGDNIEVELLDSINTLKQIEVLNNLINVNGNGCCAGENGVDCGCGSSYCCNKSNGRRAITSCGYNDDDGIENDILLKQEQLQQQPFSLQNYLISCLKGCGGGGSGGLGSANYPALLAAKKSGAGAAASIWYSDRRRLSECREEDEEEDAAAAKDETVETVAATGAAAVADEDDSAAEDDNEQVEEGCTAEDRNNSFEEDLQRKSTKTSDELLVSAAADEHKAPTRSFVRKAASLDIGAALEHEEAASNGCNHRDVVAVVDDSVAKTVQLPASETYNRPSARSLFTGMPVQQPPPHLRLSPSPLVSPHFDRKFFDPSLIEMKSQAFSSTSTLNDSLEDIWIRRWDYTESSALAKDAKNAGAASGSEDSDTKSVVGRYTSNTPTTVTSKNAKGHRRSGGGGGGNDGSGGSRSASNSRSSSKERRKSLENKQQQHHQFLAGVAPLASSSTARPRSNSDASKKKDNNFITIMRNAMRQTGLMPKRSLKDGSAHPVKDGDNSSDTKYYHTVNAAVSTNHSRSTMTKVMDIFRNRTHTSSPDDRKKSKNNEQYSLYGSNLRKFNLDADNTKKQSFGARYHRNLDILRDPQNVAILFRDSRGLPVVDPFLEKVNKPDSHLEYQIFVKFFTFHTCYDLIPNSAKLVVFDTKLSVKKAFYALLYHGVRAAPLWDCDREQFIGMLTITDFIKILQIHYNSNMKMDELEYQSVDGWNRQLKQNLPFISIGPDNSLYDAIKILIENKIHRLPIIDPETGSVLHILTHKRILRFLFLYINELPTPTYIMKSLRNSKIGTYENIEVAYESTTIIEALNKFVERGISALPIVDENGKLIDIYAKFDVIKLAADKTYNELDVTLKKANEYRNEWFEGVYRCSLDDTLYSVIEKFVKFQVHRLVIVDADEKVIGILSLSDLFKYLVLNPNQDFSETQSTSDNLHVETERKEPENQLSSPPPLLLSSQSLQDLNETLPSYFENKKIEVEITTESEQQQTLPTAVSAGRLTPTAAAAAANDHDIAEAVCDHEQADQSFENDSDNLFGESRLVEVAAGSSGSE